MYVQFKMRRETIKRHAEAYERLQRDGNYESFCRNPYVAQAYRCFVALNRKYNSLKDGRPKD